MVGRFVEHATAGGAGLVRVGVAELRPRGHRGLHGMVEEVAGEQGGLLARLDPQRDMTGGVAVARREPQAFAEIGVLVDDVTETGVEDRLHRLREDVRVVVATRILAARQRGLGVEVARSVKVGTQQPSTARVPPTWSACRCVCTTASTSRPRSPRPRRRSKNGQCWLVPERHARASCRCRRTGRPGWSGSGLDDERLNAQTDTAGVVRKVGHQPLMCSPPLPRSRRGRTIGRECGRSGSRARP